MWDRPQASDQDGIRPQRAGKNEEEGRTFRKDQAPKKPILDLPILALSGRAGLARQVASVCDVIYLKRPFSMEIIGPTPSAFEFVGHSHAEALNDGLAISPGETSAFPMMTNVEPLLRLPKKVLQVLYRVKIKLSTKYKIRQRPAIPPPGANRGHAKGGSDRAHG